MRTIIPIALAVAGCGGTEPKPPQPPQCRLTGDYQLEITVDGRPETIALHVPDPDVLFRPRRNASAERNAELRKAWFASRISAELRTPVPALEIDLDSQIFIKPDVDERCAVELKIFTGRDPITFALAVAPATGVVTGRLTGHHRIADGLPITGRLTQPSPDPPAR
jgi:hypothetical protein